MPSSKGLLIFLLGSQLLSSQGQLHYSKPLDRHHHPSLYRPAISRSIDAESQERKANPSYLYRDDIIISKTTPSHPIDHRTTKPSIRYDNDNIIQNRTTPQPPVYGPAPRFSKYTKCKPTAANTILNFARVGLKRIGDAFIASSETKELYLDDNDISHISSTAFVLLNQLEVLSLSNNKIPIEKLLWFSTLYTLRKLVVNDNTYDSSNVSKVLKALPRLEELSLQRDNISRFAVSLKEFAPRLRQLQLSGNNIDELDFLDDLPDSLSSLYLDDNAITKVRSIALKNVQELSVSGNQIEKLCADQCSDSFLCLKDMKNLQKLNASRNSISEITQKAFIDTTNLMVLDLSRNKIKTLPEDALNIMSMLQELSLSHNELGSVPKICSLVHLKHLDLSYNNIGSIAKSNLCTTMTSLHTLLLSGNYITDVDNDAFMQLPSLKKLDLSNNLILNLPVQLMHRSRSLQILLLNNNSIANIDQLFAVRSDVLRELHLQENPFCTVKYEVMPQLVVHLKKQPRQEKDNEGKEEEEEKEEDEEDEDATSNRDNDENSVYNSSWN